MRRAEFFKFPVYSNIFYSFYGMIRTIACQRMFGELGKPRYMSQIELPVLARLATAGEIFSFAQDLRYYLGGSALRCSTPSSRRFRPNHDSARSR